MLHLDQKLVTRLKAHRVRLDEPDDNTVLLAQVPTHPGFFNKAATNLLVKRPQAGSPFVIAVDEDLSYAGPDRELLRAFAGGIRQRGWLTLIIALSAQCDREQAIRSGLEILGFDGQSPRLPASVPTATDRPRAPLLSQFAVNLTERVQDETREPTVGREDETADVVSSVLCWGQARLPVVVGPSGIGKTNLLHAAARLLGQWRPELTMLLVDLNRLAMGAAFDAELENICTALLEEFRSTEKTVLALEHLEQILCGRVPGLLAEVLDGHAAGVIATLLPGSLLKIPSPLVRRLQVVRLEEPSPRQAAAMLESLRERIAAHHAIEIGPFVVEACIRAAEPLAGYYPAKSISLLDRAAAWAALSGAESLTLDDVYSIAGRMPQVME